MSELTTKVVTGKVRASYANVFKPKAIGDGAEEKYSISLLIPKSDKQTISKINKAIENAKEAGKAKAFGGKIPAKLKHPLRDGDEERPDDEAYEGMYFINASSKNPPGIIDKQGNEIINPEGFYSGCYCKAAVNFYAFNVNGNRGIAAGLNNLLFVEDGDRLSGGSSAFDDFGEDLDMSGDLL